MGMPHTLVGGSAPVLEAIAALPDDDLLVFRVTGKRPHLRKRPLGAVDATSQHDLILSLYRVLCVDVALDSSDVVLHVEPKRCGDVPLAQLFASQSSGVIEHVFSQFSAVAHEPRVSIAVLFCCDSSQPFSRRSLAFAGSPGRKSSGKQRAAFRCNILVCRRCAPHGAAVWKGLVQEVPWQRQCGWPVRAIGLARARQKELLLATLTATESASAGPRHKECPTQMSAGPRHKERRPRQRKCADQDTDRRDPTERVCEEDRRQRRKSAGARHKERRGTTRSAGARHKEHQAPTQRAGPRHRDRPSPTESPAVSARFVSGPNALYVGAALCVGSGRSLSGTVSGPANPHQCCLCRPRRSLCRGSAVSGALCVGARRSPAVSLMSGPSALRRSLCRGPALFVSGPSALCVGRRRQSSSTLSVSLHRSSALAGALCRGAAVLSQRFCVAPRRSPTQRPPERPRHRALEPDTECRAPTQRALRPDTETTRA